MKNKTLPVKKYQHIIDNLLKMKKESKQDSKKFKRKSDKM